MSRARKPRRDRRYRISREWCGAARPRHVVRFCDEWVDQASNRTEAAKIVAAHQALRREALARDEGALR